MLDTLFPARIDNTLRGHRLALWVFAVVVVLRLGIGLGSVFNGRQAAGGADGIPLDAFGPAGAQTVVSMMALLGVVQLALTALCILAWARYRAMIPLLLSVLVLEYLGRRLVLVLLPIPRTGRPPGVAVNLVILALMIAGLALSLWTRRPAAER